MVGFCTLEVKPFGPVHDQPVPAPEVRLRLAPAQMGELLPGAGVGTGFTVTFTVLDEVHPPAAVTITV